MSTADPKHRPNHEELARHSEELIREINTLFDRWSSLTRRIDRRQRRGEAREDGAAGNPRNPR